MLHIMETQKGSQKRVRVDGETSEGSRSQNLSKGLARGPMGDQEIRFTPSHPTVVVVRYEGPNAAHRG